MASSKDDPEQIVADAEAAADEAESLVVTLEDRIMAGDAAVTHEDLGTQISLARFARKLVGAAKAKAEDLRAKQAAKSRADLREEILRDAPANGEHLLAIVDALVANSNELVTAAEAHDAQVRAWAQRALALGAPDKGVISAAHAGMGVSAGGDMLVDEVRVQTVGAKNIFRLLFVPVENGIIPSPSLSNVESARSIVANIGKAVV